MAALFVGITPATTTMAFASSSRFRYASSRRKISCVWDPEGLFGPAQTGHIARLEFSRRLEKDAEAREAFDQHVRDEKERRRTLRDSRGVPETPAKLVEYFLDTEAQEIEFEIARMRTQLNDEFFSHLKLELGQLRFAVTKTQDTEDRIIELEALQKALLEGTEAYDKMQTELLKAKQSLMKILTSKNVKSTLLEMVELNELNRSLLALLDENIATAQKGNQDQAASYMEKIRAAVLKCVEQINKASRGDLTPDELKERQAKAMQDPEIQNILMDPVMRQVLVDFQENPKAAQEHTKNPMVMSKIQKLVSAGIVRIK